MPLILLELLVPGLVVIFLGIAALLVALGIYLGLLEGWMAMMTAWFFLSLILVFTLRQLFAKLAPGDTEQGNMDEDSEAFGQVVDVCAVTSQDGTRGRISFRGSTWEAESMDEPLVAGGKARLLSRDDLLWFVEPCEPD